MSSSWPKSDHSLISGVAGLVISGVLALTSSVPAQSLAANKLNWESGDGYRRAKLNVPSRCHTPGFVRGFFFTEYEIVTCRPAVLP